MADPRFYDNRGPFPLGELCGKIGVALPDGADGSALVHDVASLAGAVAEHLSFFAGDRAETDFAQTAAGFCLVPAKVKAVKLPARTVLIPCAAVQHAFVAAEELFYPDSSRMAGPYEKAIDASARIGEGVKLAPGVVIGPGAEIGDGTHLGPNTVVARGVAIGRDCEIAGNTTIMCSYIGDRVLILPGAQIGQPGYAFASGAQGHTKVPQLGRVIVQDKVEVGACVTIDRGALGDTVIGEGTKIDNLVQIGHNVHVGRHCIIVSQVGISGSSTLGDFVVLGGQVGIADHAKIGSGVRLGARSAMTPGQELERGDYAGVPAKPVREWIRELYAVNALVKKPKKGGGND
ncbi:MAG TPA: UDP-3-O-(3-hydroxymyristoyl)glucosamine N-acyltransferase [Rhizomicrobium sp.]|nr:UDP-3-O-(3-hydroxymyristoyl)glucosamine N-acyltransferase [Rhizomicrobium sp.]